MNENSSQEHQQFRSVDGNKTANSEKLIEVITDTLVDKKAQDVTVLDVNELTTLADRLVICHAQTDVHIKAIADQVNKETKERLDEKVWKEEGRETRRWVILDYVNVVVHIFKEDLREYYALERMWNDAPSYKIEDQPSKQ